MKNIFKKTSLLIAVGILTVIISTPLSAQAVSTVEANFENFTLGSLNGQNGWSIISQTADQSIVENTYGFEKFGTKVLRISNNVVVTSKDSLYTPNTDEAGETSAIAGGLSTGPRQNHFEASFDFLALGQYAGKNAMHVVLDRGDAARTGVLEFDDTAAGGGTQVWYQGYTNQFDWRYIMTIPRDQVHSFKIVVDYVDGVSNDTVKIY
ncbi:hypothetical protein K2Q02_00095, partial [Patescibacteria group bacterium]|nr:hypothetical protein [Patescibacteria group bacterium]